MSLINDMLNNLEQRRGNPQPAVDGRVDELAASARKIEKHPQKREALLVAAAVIAVVIAGFNYWSDKNESETATVVTFESPVVPAVLANKPVSVEVAATPRLVSINLLTIGAKSRLVVTLSDDVKYSVRRDGSTIELILNERVENSLQAITDRTDLVESVRVDGGKEETLIVASLLAEAEHRFSKRQLVGNTEITVDIYPSRASTVQKPTAVADSQAEAKTSDIASAGPVPAARQESTKTAVVAAAQMTKTSSILTAEQLDKKASIEARQLIQQRRFVEAEKVLAAQLQLNTNSIKSGVLYIGLLQQSGRSDEASSLIDKMLKARPGNIALLKSKARILSKQGRLDEAVALLRRQMVRISEDTEYYEILAAMEQQRGSYTAAKQLYQNLTRYNALRGDWWVGYGVALESSAERESALAAYQRAVQLPQTRAALMQYAQQRIAALR